MAQLRSNKSGGYKARKVIPVDVRAEYRALYGKGHEEIFSAPRTDSVSLAKRKHTEWLGEIESRIETLRAKKRGEGRDLTQREAQALAGEWYLWFVGRHQENPGDPWDWHQRADLMTDAVVTATPYWDAHDPFIDQSQRAKEPAVREDVHPMLADEAKTAQFLASKSEVLTQAAMVAFLDRILDHYIQACALLERRARGDYAQDTLPQSFPVFDGKKPKAPSGLTGMQLFEAYIPAAEIGAGSVLRWRTVFKALDAHLDGRSVDSLSEDEAQKWVASLVTKKRKAFTVMNTYVASLLAVCRWAVNQRLITVNPFTKAGVKVPEHQKPKSRPPGRETKAFTDDEVKLILRSALAIHDTRRASAALRRWVPWLLAYTGARAGEITQLRGQDVITRDGIVALRLTQEAGTIKTKEDRTVPLHQHVIDQGFLDYVHSKGQGPLFYNVDERAPVAADTTNTKRPRAAEARDNLREWTRSIGVADPEVQPTHGWRHTFKQRADRYEISERISDAITGHAPTTEGRGYGAPTLADMAAALRKFPRYEV